MPEHLKHHEKQPHAGEHLNNHEATEAKKNLERLKEDAEKAKHTEQHRDLAEIHKSIKEKAVDSDKVVIDKEDETPSQPILGVQRELKADAYKRTLKTVQRELNTTDRAFSKVIHQPLIETISNVSEKTIARPSALLGGGITALIGSSIVLYMSKHYGFPYSTFLFFALFVAGFGLGVLIEFGLRLTVKKRSTGHRRS